MSGDTTSDEEGSQEDSPRYDIDDLEIIKTIGEHDAIFNKEHAFSMPFTARPRCFLFLLNATMRLET